MVDATLFYKTNSQDEMVKTYIQMQVEQLTQAYEAPAVVEVNLFKKKGEYVAQILFICDEFAVEAVAKSWSPYKSIELASVNAKDQILQRIYSIYAYA